jgi:hypothetical protein
LVFFDVIGVDDEELSHSIQNGLLGLCNSQLNLTPVCPKQGGVVSRMPLL